jgi:hypothetical protein
VEQVKKRGCQLASTFFGLTQEYKVEVLRTMMKVSHYSKGAFSFMELYSMPVYMRNFLIREFGKLKEDESRELDRLRNK